MTQTPTKIAQRTAELHAFAARRGVRFTDQEAADIVAITFRQTPAPPIIRPGVRTAIGMAQTINPDSPYLILRRGDEAWMVPDQPDGWEYREPWLGDLNALRWIGGPPAIAACRRVGAPV